MIHRDVEEPLDLRLVQIHRQHAVGAGRAQQVRHELGRDRHARLVLAVLPRVAVIRNHRRDARRRRAAERVDHDQHLHQMLVDRVRRRLHDEDVGAADVLVDLKRHLAVGEPPQPRLPERDAEEVGNLLRQLRMGAARKYLQVAESGRHQPFTAERSFHPARPCRRVHACVRNCAPRMARLAPPGFAATARQAWLGREDSNLRIRDPKSRALPLGHAPPCQCHELRQTGQAPSNRHLGVTSGGGANP